MTTPFTYEQDPSEPLPNVRHEHFARGLALGQTAVDAYAAAGFKGKNKKYRIQLKKSDAIQARVAALRAEAERLAGLEKSEALRFLHSVIATPIGSVGPDSPLCQAFDISEATGGDPEDPSTVRRIKKRMPDKLVALRMLSTLCGWANPVPQPPPVSALTRAVRELRHRGRVQGG